MVEFTSKPLGDGQLAITPTSIYEVPPDRRQVKSQAVINLVTAHNTNAATQTVLLYLQPRGSTSQRILRRVELAQNETADLISNFGIVHMREGDQLVAQTTTASAVDYAVFGEEMAG